MSAFKKMDQKKGFIAGIKEAYNEVGNSASTEIVPDSFRDDSFNILQEIENFKSFISAIDVENSKKSLIVINKYFHASKIAPTSVLDKETIMFVISLLKLEVEGPEKIDAIVLKKEAFSLIINIAEEGEESAAFLIENNIFSELNPLLISCSDMFSSKLTSKLFLKIINNGEMFCANGLENGIFDATREAIHFFMGKGSSEYMSNVIPLLEVLLKIVDFPSIVEENVMQLIIKEAASILNNIYKSVSTPPFPVDPLFPDDPLTNIPPTVFEISIIKLISDFVAACPNKNPGIVQYVFAEKIVFVLNDILMIPRTASVYECILSMDLNLAISLNSEEELITALLDYINPVHVMNLFIQKPTEQYSRVALKYLNNAISIRAEIINMLPLEEFIQIVSETISDISFSFKVEIVRVSLAIIWQGGDDFFEAMLSQGILQSFLPVFAEAEDDIKFYSIIAFTRVIERYIVQRKSCDEIKGFLNSEYKELLDEWSNLSSANISSASVVLIEALGE
jgi:hypothetical protein